MRFYESFSVTVREFVVLGVTADKKYSRSDTDRTVEGDAMYVKAFEQQSIPDTGTLPLTYILNRAVWPSTRPNQSAIESNDATNQSPAIVIEANQSNKVLFEAQTNYQSLMKMTNNQLPIYDAVEPTETQTSTNSLV